MSAPWWSRRRRGRFPGASLRPAARVALECLEDRTLPAVAPLGLATVPVVPLPVASADQGTAGLTVLPAASSTAASTGGTAAAASTLASLQTADQSMPLNGPLGLTITHAIKALHNTIGSNAGNDPVMNAFLSRILPAIGGAILAAVGNGGFRPDLGGDNLRGSTFREELPQSQSSGAGGMPSGVGSGGSVGNFFGAEAAFGFSLQAAFAGAAEGLPSLTGVTDSGTVREPGVGLQRLNNSGVGVIAIILTEAERNAGEKPLIPPVLVAPLGPAGQEGPRVPMDHLPPPAPDASLKRLIIGVEPPAGGAAVPDDGVRGSAAPGLSPGDVGGAPVTPVRPVPAPASPDAADVTGFDVPPATEPDRPPRWPGALFLLLAPLAYPSWSRSRDVSAP